MPALMKCGPVHLGRVGNLGDNQRRASSKKTTKRITDNRAAKGETAREQRMSEGAAELAKVFK